MVVGLKDGVRLMGVMVIVCCAVLVCTMFMNFYFDLWQIEALTLSEQARIFYHAQTSVAKVICSITGGCLLLTSAIMLLFYMKHYIDTHRKELGILKALGYSNLEIAKHFWVFGTSVFIGAAAGFCGAFLLMPAFYGLQNEESLLPQLTIRFHPTLLLYFVILPTAAFAALAILYSFFKLKKPALMLLKEDLQAASKTRGRRVGKDRPFLEVLKKNTLRERKILVFFIVFSSFCFSAMTQMSTSMRDLSSAMMGEMILLIGMVLACTTLFLAITTVIRGNSKAIAMMGVFGYSGHECRKALLNGYRPMSYLGFVLGTAYQYGLLRMMVDIVFRDVDGVPVYEFDLPVMLISLVLFLAVYEGAMYGCAKAIRRISLREVMAE